MNNYGVSWDNECGYGVDWFKTQQEQEKFIADCRRYGTNAVKVYREGQNDTHQPIKHEENEMKATHIASINTVQGLLKFRVVIVRQEGNRMILQQVKNGKLYGATFTADSIEELK